MSLWNSGEKAINKCYDKVYYRVDDFLSIEISGDGKLSWFKTNNKTHRMHQCGGFLMTWDFPLYTNYRPTAVNWV